MAKGWDFFCDAEFVIDDISHLWYKTRLCDLAEKVAEIERSNEPIESTPTISPAPPTALVTSQEHERSGIHGSLTAEDEELRQIELPTDVALYGPAYPALVRDFLDAGELVRLLDKFSSPDIPYIRNIQKDWKFILVATCAMMLGCNFPPGYIEKLSRANRTHIAVKSYGYPGEIIERAVLEYVNGKPYKFDDYDLARRDLTKPVAERSGENTPHAPQLEPFPPMPPLVPDLELQGRQWPRAGSFDHPVGSCANCGAIEGYSRHQRRRRRNQPIPPMQRCKRCKQTAYCFDGCQEWHWWEHKRFCDKRYEMMVEAGQADEDIWRR